MNLYRVTSTHYAPKDSHSSTMGFLLAYCDEQVYLHLREKFEFYEESYYNSWGDQEGDEEEFEMTDDEGNDIGTESLRELYVRIGGEDNYDSAEVNDAYYGVTHYGWELFKANLSEEDQQVLLSTGVATKIY